MTTPANGRRGRGRNPSTRRAASAKPSEAVAPPPPKAATTPAETPDPETAAPAATDPPDQQDESLELAAVQTAADAVEEVVLEVDLDVEEVDLDVEEVVDFSTTRRSYARTGSPPDEEEAFARSERAGLSDLAELVRSDVSDRERYPLEYYQLLDVQRQLMVVDQELLEASACVDDHRKSVQQAQRELSSAERDVQKVRVRRDKGAAAAAELLAKLANLLISVEPSGETVQGGRTSIVAELAQDPLPPNLRIRWLAKGLPIIEQSPDGRRVQVDARNVQAGRYNIDVSLVWDRSVSSY